MFVCKGYAQPYGRMLMYCNSSSETADTFHICKVVIALFINITIFWVMTSGSLFKFTNVIIIFLRGLGRLTCSGIDALPSFPGASKVSSSSKFVVEGMFRKSGVVRSFKVVDPVFFYIRVSRLVLQRSLVLFL